uniref:Uncharacterized protein n=1 Tax=Arion vulgaris TaxID=1028688 RepID=A0A0B6ZT44_9EUPU
MVWFAWLKKSLNLEMKLTATLSCPIASVQYLPLNPKPEVLDLLCNYLYCNNFTTEPDTMRHSTCTLLNIKLGQRKTNRHLYKLLSIKEVLMEPIHWLVKFSDRLICIYDQSSDHNLVDTGS